MGGSMATAGHLSRPPIHEAILDFVFVGAESKDDVLESLVSSLTKDGWTKHAITETTFRTFIGPQAEASGVAPVPVLQNTKAAVVGYALREVEGHRIIQVREDRLTVSHSQKYEDWAALERDARNSLQRYVESMKPSSISRIATRFINRVALPEEQHIDFRNYLTNPPNLVEGLGSAVISDFIRRQVIQGLDHGFSAILNVATAAPIKGEVSKPLLVDIDVYKQGEVPLSEEVLDSSFHALHETKNAIFFGSLTDHALEQYR